MCGGGDKICGRGDEMCGVAIGCAGEVIGCAWVAMECVGVNVLSDVSYHEPCQVGDEIDDYCNLADADQEHVAGGEPVAFSDTPAVQAQMDGYDEQQHGEAEQEEGIDGDGLADVAMQQGMGCPLTSA